MSYLDDLPPEILEMVYRFLHRKYMNELAIPYFAGFNHGRKEGELGGLKCPVCHQWIWCFAKGVRIFTVFGIADICLGKCIK